MRSIGVRAEGKALPDDTQPSLPCFAVEGVEEDDAETRELPCVTLLDAFVRERAQLSAGVSAEDTTVFDSPAAFSAGEPAKLAGGDAVPRRSAVGATSRKYLARAALGLVVVALMLSARIANRRSKALPATSAAPTASRETSSRGSRSTQPIPSSNISSVSSRASVPHPETDGPTRPRVAVAVRALMDGRVVDAQREYAELSDAHSGDTTFATMARILARRAAPECADGELATLACPELRR